MEYSRAKAADGHGWVYGYPVVVPELPYPPEPPAGSEEGQPPLRSNNDWLNVPDGYFKLYRGQ